MLSRMLPVSVTPRVEVMLEAPEALADDDIASERARRRAGVDGLRAPAARLRAASLRLLSGHQRGAGVDQDVVAVGALRAVEDGAQAVGVLGRRAASSPPRAGCARRPASSGVSV